MPTINILMLIRKAQTEHQRLQNKYLHKSIYINKGHLSVVYYVHKVKHGWLYCYHGNTEIRFKPHEVEIACCN